MEQTQSLDKKDITTQEIAELLGVHRNVYYEQSNEIGTVTIGHGTGQMRKSFGI